MREGAAVAVVVVVALETGLAGGRPGSPTGPVEEGMVVVTVAWEDSLVVVVAVAAVGVCVAARGGEAASCSMVTGGVGVGSGGLRCMCGLVSSCPDSWPSCCKSVSLSLSYVRSARAHP